MCEGRERERDFLSSHAWKRNCVPVVGSYSRGFIPKFKTIKVFEDVLKKKERGRESVWVGSML